MLKERIITAVIGGSLLLAAVYLGGFFSLAAALILLVVASYEIASIAGFNSIQKVLTIAVSLASFYFMLNNTIFYSIFLLLPVLTFKKTTNRSNLYPFVFLLYSTLALHLFYRYAKPEYSFFPIIVLLVLVWTSDTVAYFVGLKFGQKKIAPQVSPNKTVEGTLAGIFFGALSYFLMSTFFNNDTFLSAIIKGLALSIAAFLGDLFESHFKRVFGVKDSGKILPGHGGVLDRFDSLFLVLIVYSLFNLTRW